MLAFNVNKSAKMLGIVNPSVNTSYSFRGTKTYSLVSLPRQQVKMLIALNDSTHTTVARYLQPEFVEAFDNSGGDMAKFFSNITKFSSNSSAYVDPLDDAISMLKGAKL